MLCCTGKIIWCVICCRLVPLCCTVCLFYSAICVDFGLLVFSHSSFYWVICTGMYLYTRLNGQLSLKKKILRVFLESGTKNIIIIGLSVKEHFLYQMPSIVIKVHSSVTVILLLWKQVFLTTCKKRSAMWNCKMTYNHALLINL